MTTATADQPAGTSYATAAARLEVSYGMSGVGARLLLAEALQNGSARSADIRVTCICLITERFEIRVEAGR